jgi:signal peptidase I
VLTHLREYAEAILVAVILALFAKAYVFEAFEIPSGSMETNLLVGDHVLVDKFCYAPHRGPWARLLPYRDVARGEVFVFRSPKEPSRDLIKRAVAVSGDTVRIERKRVSIDGTPLEEPYARHRDPRTYTNEDVPAPLRGRDDFGPLTVPPGTVFALGDNRDDSLDSRFLGTAPVASVRGRALLVYWSYEQPRRAFAGRGAGLRKVLDTAVHFVSRTRWERSFRAVR